MLDFLRNILQPKKPQPVVVVIHLTMDGHTFLVIDGTNRRHARVAALSRMVAKVLDEQCMGERR